MGQVMRTFLKILGGVIGAVVILGAVAVAWAYFGSERKLHRTVEVTVAPIAIPTDSAAIDRGGYLYASRGCKECHGSDGAGKVVFNEGGFYAEAPHISAGEGSVTAAYKPEDWVRTIRHGVKPSRQPLLIMPSEDYARLTDADVGAVVAFIKSLPPVEGTPAEFRVPLIVRLLYTAGVIEDAAEKINHKLPPSQPVAAGDIVGQGRYVAAACQGCHNASFSGGLIPGAPPSWPAAANLTPGEGTVIGRYPDAKALAAMFRSGRRPDGTDVNPAMPFETLSTLSDDDISALYAYLKTLPPKKKGDAPPA